MFRSSFSILVLSLLGSAGAAESLPPALAIGFAEGFVSDDGDLLVCGQDSLGEIGYFRQAFKDLKEGIIHFNVTELEDALDELKDVVENIGSTEKSCKTVVVDLKSTLEALKQIKGPKDFILHIVHHLVWDGERIFGELAAADHAYKTGWDFMTAGKDLGMAIRRTLVGEAGDAPPTTPAPAGAKKELFEGFVEGFLSNNYSDFMECRRDVSNEGEDFAHAVKDFELGLRHLNLTEIKHAVEEFEMFIKGAADTKATCKTFAVAVEKDVKAIVSALKKIHGPKALVLEIVHNLFSHGDDIFGDLAVASKAYQGAEYAGSGRQLGMAFRTMLIGEPTATNTLLLTTQNIIV